MANKKLLYTHTDNPFAWREESGPSSLRATQTRAQSTSYYSPTPSVIEIKAESFYGEYDEDQVAGPSKTHYQADLPAGPSVDRYFTPSDYRRTSSPKRSSSLTWPPSERPQSPGQLIPWQPARTPTPFPKQRNQLLSHIEIPDLNEILADPEWRDVREKYLVSQRRRREAYEREWRRKAKGKEREVVWGGTSGDSEEDEVDHALRHQRSFSRTITDSSRSTGQRSRSSSYASQHFKFSNGRKRAPYSYREGYGDSEWGLGMDDVEFDDVYTPSDDSEDRRRARKPQKGRKIQRSRNLTKEPSYGDDRFYDSSTISRQLSVTLESTERTGMSPQSIAQSFDRRPIQIDEVPRSIHLIPSKRPRKRKRRFGDDSSDSEGRLMNEAVSSSSEWEEERELGTKQDMQKVVASDPTLLMSRNGKRVHSIFTGRTVQRELRIFTPEERARIDAESRYKWCHMCHKKNLVMLCDSSAGKRCRAGFCDHCLAKYPLPFEPFATFVCPRCDGTCICAACMRLRAKGGAKKPAKRELKAGPKTKLSKAAQAEQARFVAASRESVQAAEQMDANGGDVPLADVVHQPATVVRRTTSTLSPPPPPSPSPRPTQQGTPITEIRWSMPPSTRTASPGIQSRQSTEIPTTTPLTPLRSAIWLEDDPYSRPKTSLSEGPSPSSARTASYFAKQLKLMEAQDADELKQLRESTDAISALSPQEVYDSLVAPVPVEGIKRKYGFRELDPRVVLPGQTWVGDVGMFGFDEQDAPEQSHPLRLSTSSESSRNFGINPDMLELKSPPKLQVDISPEILDFALSSYIEMDADEHVATVNGDPRLSVDPSPSDTHSRTVSGSSDVTDEVTPSRSTSTIVPEEGDDWVSYALDVSDSPFNPLNTAAGAAGLYENLDALAGLGLSMDPRAIGLSTMMPATFVFV
ncbi:hypothetical protein FRB90_003910 [Tulasnella sp. 427]|nr:hypothetical protein FRB90_003910 [Tulasnella sp. 427]